jgi:protein-tyrosine-phosphatase
MGARPVSPRDLEHFELLNTASQLKRAAEHAFDFHGGTVPAEECLRVVQDSYELLARTAKVTHHLVPLAERWAIERLRRYAILDHRLARAVPEVLFVDIHDATSAPIAAALLTFYARGRLNVASAGRHPRPGVEPLALEVLAHTGIDASDAFPKPITDDALAVADLVVILGGAALPDGPVPEGQQRTAWDTPALHGGEPREVFQAHRDDLDHRVLLLLAELLTPVDDR